LPFVSSSDGRTFSHLLPREIRLCGPRDGAPQGRIADSNEPVGHLRWKLAGRRNGPRDASFGGSIDGGQGADLESKLVHVDAPRTKTRADFVGKKRQLVRPYARRDSEQEHAS
jgi:hypothetical protein